MLRQHSFERCGAASSDQIGSAVPLLQAAHHAHAHAQLELGLLLLRAVRLPLPGVQAPAACTPPGSTRTRCMFLRVLLLRA
jgi:hypothetical protein